MPTKFKLVIADTSCFILLDKIQELELLKNLFDEVITTPEIEREFGKELPEWIDHVPVKHKEYQASLALTLDEGEASAIALSAEVGNALLIPDDLPARKLADKLDLNFTGTLGIIARARREGIFPSVKPIIEKIRKTNFRFSDEVFNEIIKAAGEE